MADKDNDNKEVQDQENLDQLDVSEIYELLLKTTNRVLHLCKNFPIYILQLEDPSITKLAEWTMNAALLVSDQYNHGYFDTMVGIKAMEYAEDLKLIADAVRNEDQERLNELTKDLDRRPFL